MEFGAQSSKHLQTAQQRAACLIVRPCMAGPLSSYFKGVYPKWHPLGATSIQAHTYIEHTRQDATRVQSMYAEPCIVIKRKVWQRCT